MDLKIQREQISQEKQKSFKDPSRLTKWAKRFLYVQIFLSLIAIISNALEYQLLINLREGVYVSGHIMTVVEASDLRQNIIAIVRLVVFVILYILILKWIYRANFNARHIGASGMVFTPGWSIGWYFVPIACYWKPYQAMKEIWKTSANPNNWSSQSVPTLLPWWWFLWVVSSILGSASLRLSWRALETNEILKANFVTQLADLSLIPLSLIMIAIVNRVYQMQMSHAKFKFTDK